MRHLLGLAVVAVLAGCGSDSNRPSIGANQDNVCDQIASVRCYDMYQCCPESDIERYLNVTDPRTEDQCRDDLRRRCERQTATVDFSIKNKHVQFNSELMNQCLDSLLAPGDNTCSTVTTMPLPWIDACAKLAWVGSVAAGAQCDYTYEC